MSFLYNPVARLHGTVRGERPTQPRPLRKSQSHGGLLNPLLRLAKSPRNALEELWAAEDAVKGGDSSRIAAVPQNQALRDRKEVLYMKLKESKTHTEWHETARELDELEGNNDWKEQDESDEYNFALVNSRLQQLDEARTNCDVKRMLFLIRTALTRSLGGMGDLRLYKHSHVGTKALIERYIDSVQKTMLAIMDISATRRGQDIDSRAILEQFLQARQSFGRSALLLSGGGTFGMNHIGVVKTLFETKLLPRLVSGASAGSIVAAVLCSRTDEELPDVMEEFCYGDLDVFEKDGEDDGVLTKVARFLKHGSLFDISNLIRVMRSLLGDMTFQEAYNRTRRILNIPVSTASLYELPRLLNYITAPNVLIWSAVAASCSVPLVFSAASLLAKDPNTGEEVPWNSQPGGWIDGSVDNDLPMTRLAEMFNVNHFIVSQVNPHVVPFVNDEGPKGLSSSILNGDSWFNSMANVARGEVLYRMHVLADLGIFPNTFTKVRSILSQRYAGDINIFPDIDLAQLPRVLSNPDTEFMLEAMLKGERATWPKLSRIQNHCAIEIALDEAVTQLRARVAFSPSQVDLRQSLHGYSRPKSAGSDRVRKRLFSRNTHHPTLALTKSADIFTLADAEAVSKAPLGSSSTSRKHAHRRHHERSRTSDPDFLARIPSPSDPLSSSHDDDFADTSTFDDVSSDDSSTTSTESPAPTESRKLPLSTSVSQPVTPVAPRLPSVGAPSPFAMAKKPEPHPAAQVERQRQGESHGASTPEARYKRLFHRFTGHGKGSEPTGPSPMVTIEPPVPSEAVPSALASSSRPGSRPGSRGHSRRSSAASLTSAQLSLDISGTRRMLLRRKQSENNVAGLWPALEK